MTVLPRHIVLSAFGAGAAAAAIAVAAPAFALSTVNVTAGSASSGTIVTVQGVASSFIALKDLTTGATGSCSSSNLIGTTTAGANSPSAVAQINGGAGQIGFNGCTTLGLPFQIDGVAFTKWTMSATGNTASGTTPINIRGINVAVSSTSCNFNVTGSATGSFVNGNPSKITIAATSTLTSKLVVHNVVLKGGATKCLGGAVTNTSPGNQISLSGSYTTSALASAYNPVSIIAT